MLADRHKYFARHVTAFLGTRSLILDVNTCRSILDEQLGKLHDRCEAAVTGISVGYDGSKEVRVCYTSSLVFWGRQTFFALFTIMEELGEEKLVNLVGNGVLSLISMRAGKTMCIELTIG